MNENYELMQTFLDIIKELAISNPNTEMDINRIYSILAGYGISPENHPYESTDDILNNLESAYIWGHNIEPRRWNSFLVFDQGHLEGNEIKLYIPLGKNHMEKGGKELLNFLESNNIASSTKFANIVRNDDIVIRVNTLEDAEKIINFVESNECINEGAIKINPFLSNMSGVGLAMDNMESYNAILCEIISNYTSTLKKEGILDKMSLEGLNSYIKKYAKNINNLDKKDIYDLLAKTTSKDFKIQDFYDHANNKLIDKYDAFHQRIIDPKYYFEEAVKATYIKYPKNISKAILNYINFGESKDFIDNDNVRLGLIKYVNPEDVVDIMKSELITYSIPVPTDNETLINSYLNQLLKYVKTDSELKEILRMAFVNTYNKYDEEQAKYALEKFIKIKDTLNFTNDDGYRDKLESNIFQINPKELVLSEIDLNGLDTNNIDEMVNRYADSLSDYLNTSNKKI